MEQVEKIGAFNLLINGVADELELANDAYMEADTIEAWQEFNEHCEWASFNLKSCILVLDKLAETAPSSIDPDAIRRIKDTIDQITNIRIGFWQKWGKRMKADDDAKVIAMERWTCASLLVAGIYKGDMDSVEGEAYCKNQCRFRETCDGEGL
ncbi:hypothetical protein ACFLXO_04795 [Chloroflexota bacterium]